jgi:hypothetical protein
MGQRVGERSYEAVREQLVLLDDAGEDGGLLELGHGCRGEDRRQQQHRHE